MHSFLLILTVFFACCLNPSLALHFNNPNRITVCTFKLYTAFFYSIDGHFFLFFSIARLSSCHWNRRKVKSKYSWIFFSGTLHLLIKCCVRRCIVCLLICCCLAWKLSIVWQWHYRQRDKCTGNNTETRAHSSGEDNPVICLLSLKVHLIYGTALRHSTRRPLVSGNGCKRPSILHLFFNEPPLDCALYRLGTVSIFQSIQVGDKVCSPFKHVQFHRLPVWWAV